MKTDKILQMIPNTVPLRAVFHNEIINSGIDVPVVGFALVESFINDKSSQEILVGIAICEDGLGICEVEPNFINYAEPIRYNTGTNEIIENNPVDVYNQWAKKQQDCEGDRTDTEVMESEPEMRVIRTGIGDDRDLQQKSGSESSNGVVDGDDDDKRTGSPQ